MPTRPLGVCWIGGTRYTQPLNLTSAKKWRLLTSTLTIEVYSVGLSADWRFRHFTEAGARFYLLPELPSAALRYLEMAVIGWALALWVVFRYGARVLVAQSPYEGAIAALVKTIARLFGVRVVLLIENHGDFEVMLFQQRRVTFAGVYRRMMRLSAGYALRQADLLRAVSATSKAQLETWLPGKPVEQFMTWVDADAFMVERPEPPSQVWDVLYAGVLIPRKGVHTLLEAFARVAPRYPQARLWLVGKPENREYAAQMEAKARQLGLDERVVFVGGVDRRELAEYMARARVMVLVSQSEGLPRVVIEAMLGGLPVIASRVSGIPEVIEDGTTGYLVPPEEVDALETALIQVFESPDIDTLSERARTFARSYFSDERYADGYRRLFDAARAALQPDANRLSSM